MEDIFIILILILLLYILHRVESLFSQISAESRLVETRLDSNIRLLTEKINEISTALSSLKHKVGNLKQGTQSLKQSVISVGSGVSKNQIVLNLLFQHLMAVESKVKTLQTIDHRLTHIEKRSLLHLNTLARLESNVTFYGRVSVQICKMFVIDELADTVLNGVDLNSVTRYKIIPFRELDTMRDLDLPKIVKGDTGEILVHRFLLKYFPDVTIEHTGTAQSSPDYVITMSDGRKLCIEVKNWEIPIDTKNRNKFKGYLSRSEYTAGLIVNIGKGAVDGDDGTKFVMGKLCEKTVIFIGSLNYDMRLLYCGVKMLLMSSN